MNDIDNAAKRRAVFLSVVGAATYKTLRNLITPEKPADKMFAKLVAVLAKQYKPKPSEIMERFKFHCRYAGRVRTWLSFERPQNFVTLELPWRR